MNSLSDPPVNTCFLSYEIVQYQLQCVGDLYGQKPAVPSDRWGVGLALGMLFIRHPLLYQAIIQPY